MEICYIDNKTGEVIPEANVSVQDFSYINNNTEKATFEEIEGKDEFIAIVKLKGETYEGKMSAADYFEGKSFYIKLQ